MSALIRRARRLSFEGWTVAQIAAETRVHPRIVEGMLFARVSA